MTFNYHLKLLPFMVPLYFQHPVFFSNLYFSHEMKRLNVSFTFHVHFLSFLFIITFTRFCSAPNFISVSSAYFISHYGGPN